MEEGRGTQVGTFKGRTDNETQVEMIRNNNTSQVTGSKSAGRTREDGTFKIKQKKLPVMQQQPYHAQSPFYSDTHCVQSQS